MRHSPVAARTSALSPPMFKELSRRGPSPQVKGDPLVAQMVEDANMQPGQDMVLPGRNGEKSACMGRLVG